MSRRHAAAALFACALLGASAWSLGPRRAVAEGDPLLPATERVLDNGLRVIVHEDHDIPNVALYVFWRVGSRNERPGITGIAHMFEHMMFTGGRRYGAAFDTTMEAAGGSNNAYTSNDVTVYQDWFPSSALPLILDMEADRMSGMAFDPETVESERGVVTGEYRLWMEEPAERMRVQLWAAAYTAHPYQWSVLGWPSDIAGWTKADLEGFFALGYAPQNAVLVLSGAVDADEALAMIEERMGKIPRGPELPPVTTVEPEQKGERRVVVEDPSAELPQVMAAWHVPATSHADTPALEVLERLLLHGRSASLRRVLVDEHGLCISVAGGLQGMQFDPSLFAIECVLTSGGETAEVERLMYAEIERLAASGPSDERLRAARNGLRVALLRRMRTIDGKAELLGETQVFWGDHRRLRARLGAFADVTADDVMRVAGAYFEKRNRTVCTLELVEDEE